MNPLRSVRRPKGGAVGTTDDFDTALDLALHRAPDPALDPGLDPARIKFRSLLVVRVLAFEAYRKQALGGDDPFLALTGISDLAHKISGVSATLGFAQLGARAAALERSMAQRRRLHADPAQFLAAIEPRLEALLNAMEALIDD